MMEEPIDEIPDVKSPGCLRNLDFGWPFQNPACDVQSQVSWTLVKRPRGVMRRTALQTKPRWDCRPGPVQKDKNTTSPRNPGTSNKRNRVVGGRENKIQLVGREMKCKNNRWEEGQRRRELQSEFTIG